jgi:hypothetical protein
VVGGCITLLITPINYLLITIQNRFDTMVERNTNANAEDVCSVSSSSNRSKQQQRRQAKLMANEMRKKRLSLLSAAANNNCTREEASSSTSPPSSISSTVSSSHRNGAVCRNEASTSGMVQQGRLRLLQRKWKMFR